MLKKTHRFVIPFVHKFGFVGKQMYVPVEGFKVTNEVVVDMARSAFFEVWSPVLIIVADIFVN